MISLIKRKTAELVTGECCAKFTLGMLKDIYKVSPLRSREFGRVLLLQKP